MAALRNSFENAATLGLANGTDITKGSGGNSGGTSGDYFDTDVSAQPTGSVFQYATAAAYEGSWGGRVRCSTTLGYVGGSFYGTRLGSLAGFYGRFFIKADAMPPNFTYARVATFLNSTGAGQIGGGIFFGTQTGAGLIYIGNASGVGVANSTVIPSAGNWYRIEYFVSPGTGNGTTADGYVTLRVYSDPTAASGTAGSGSYDERNAAGATAMWAFPSPTIGWVHHGISASAPFPTTNAAQYLNLDRIDVGQTSGWYGNLSQSAQYSLPISDSVVNGWVSNTGATTGLYQAIGENPEDDTTYIQSPIGPANSATRYKLSTIVAPSGTVSLTWVAAKSAVTGKQIDVTVKIYQGGGNVLGAGTLVNTFTHTNIGTTPTTFVEPITGTVTNWGDLYIEFTANQV